MNHLASLTTLVRKATAFSLPAESTLSDAELIDAQRLVRELRRLADLNSARLAAEMARRSRPELGYDGLAQRLGARTPHELLRTLTGIGAREASTLLSVGEMMATADPAAGSWIAAVCDAVRSGALPTEAATVIRRALDGLDLADEDLLAAANELITAAHSVDADRLAAHGRQVRDRLDAAGVAYREQQLRDARFINFTPQRNGMTRVIGMLDPETAAEFRAVVDAATSPRRGGPRFVGPAGREREQRLLEDPRTIGQITLDSLATVLKAGARSGGADVTALLGVNLPAVRIHVAATDLTNGNGSAQIEGQTSSVSVQTAARHACTAGIVPIQFDDSGQLLNLGRTQRRFSTRQRIALSARDGGCRFPECDRPPGWTEAHHITPWEIGGRTDVADGIQLCRHHHMLIHNNGWRVTRADGDYFVIPPPTRDPEQKPIPAPTKQRVRADVA